MWLVAFLSVGGGVVSDVAIEDLEWTGRGLPHFTVIGIVLLLRGAAGRGRAALVLAERRRFCCVARKANQSIPQPDRPDKRKAISRTGLRAQDRDCHSASSIARKRARE